MSDLGRQAHWENVYTTKDEKAVSWYQKRPDVSVDLIRATGVDASASIIDIGGGASRLVDALIDEGFKAVTILDLSEIALATSKARLGARGAQVQWVVADVTTWEPSQTYDVWHDRATFIFRSLNALALALLDKTALHLSDHAQNCHHNSACFATSADVRVKHGHERLPLIAFMHDVENVAGVAP